MTDPEVQVMVDKEEDIDNNGNRLAPPVAPVRKPTPTADVERVREVLAKFPCRCSDDDELDFLRRGEAARAILAALHPENSHD